MSFFDDDLDISNKMDIFGKYNFNISNKSSLTTWKRILIIMIIWIKGLFRYWGVLKNQPFFGRILTKSIQEKKFLEKKPGNKNFGKKVPIFNKVLSFNFLGLVPKIIWGLPIKSREIKSVTGIKALQKKSLENEVKS